MSRVQARNVNHPQHSESLNAQKYALIRAAILEALHREHWLPFTELEARVRTWLEQRHTPAELFPKPGSVRWYCKAVQLDLEARGIIERQPKKSPLHLRRCH